MNEQDLLKELRDIKPLLDVPDSSIYIFYLFFAASALLLFLLCYKLYKFLSKKRRVDAKAKALEVLKGIDFSEPKSAAYTITKYGLYFCDDQSTKEAYTKLVSMLDEYKYKKEVPQINNDTIYQYNHFMALIHV